MARPRRSQAAGIYHVTTRAIRGSVLFVDDADRMFFLLVVRSVVRRHGWSLHAYCLMPNHYHLLVHVPEGTLSIGMHHLNSVYASWFNSRHGFAGHVFGGRFYAGAIEGDGHLLEAARYIVRNPVRAGLCARVSDWAWSSYRALVGLARCPDFLAAAGMLAYFAPDSSRAQAIYAAFVDDAPRRGPP